MYSFQAIAAIDTVNYHGGFHFFAIIAGLIVFLMILFCNDIGETRVIAMLLGALVGLSALISYNTGEIKVYTNKPVEATLVGFQAEGYSISERSGKTTRQVDKHEQFVVYAVPEGNVMFPAAMGQTYPKKAILYKN